MNPPPAINGQCTNFILFDVALYIKGLAIIGLLDKKQLSNSM